MNHNFEPLDTLFSWAVFIKLQRRCSKNTFVLEIPLQCLDLQILCFQRGKSGFICGIFYDSHSSTKKQLAAMDGNKW